MNENIIANIISKNFTHPNLVRQSYRYRGKPALIKIRKNNARLNLNIYIIDELNGVILYKFKQFNFIFIKSHVNNNNVILYIHTFNFIMNVFLPHLKFHFLIIGYKKSVIADIFQKQRRIGPTTYIFYMSGLMSFYNNIY